MKRLLLSLAGIAGGYLAGSLVLRVVLIALGPRLRGSTAVFYAPAAGLWLAGLGAALLAFCWSFRPGRRGWWPAVLAAAMGAGIDCAGLKKINIITTTTVNGQVRWHFESRWLFAASLALGILVLACALWKSWKPEVPPKVPGPGL